MSADEIPPAENFDGAADVPTPEPAESAGPPEHVDPGEAYDGARSDEEADRDEEDLSVFEPPEPEEAPGDRDDTTVTGGPELGGRDDADEEPEPRGTPAARPAVPEDDDTGDVGDEAGEAAARAREEAARQARPADEVRGRFDPEPDEVEDGDGEPVAVEPEEAGTDEVGAGDGAGVAGEEPDLSAFEPEGGAEPKSTEPVTDGNGVEPEPGEADGGEVDDTADNHESMEEGESLVGEHSLSDVDTWQKEIEEHEHVARTDGYCEPPDMDLEEMEELLHVMDPGAAVSVRGHQMIEGDDGWESGRDATGSSLPEKFEEDADPDDAGAEIHEIATDRQITTGTGPSAQPRWDDSFVQAARDMGLVGETARYLADYQAERAEPEGDRLAEVVPLNFGAGRQAAAASGDTPDGDGSGAKDEKFFGTPQGRVEHPRELVSAMDFLMEHVGGDIGEMAALVLADEYEATGKIPIGLPSKIEKEIEEEMQRRVAGE